jgi:hypothetical protein
MRPSFQSDVEEQRPVLLLTCPLPQIFSLQVNPMTTGHIRSYLVRNQKASRFQFLGIGKSECKVYKNTLLNSSKNNFQRVIISGDKSKVWRNNLLSRQPLHQREIISSYLIFLMSQVRFNNRKYQSWWCLWLVPPLSSA